MQNLKAKIRNNPLYQNCNLYLGIAFSLIMIFGINKLSKPVSIILLLAYAILVLIGVLLDNKFNQKLKLILISTNIVGISLLIMVTLL